MNKHEKNSPATMKRYGTVLRCWDNGGRSADRFTIMPPKSAGEYRESTNRLLMTALAANRFPYHPQGIGMVATAMAGPHLGRRVPWSALSPDVQRFAREAFPEFAPA